MQTNLLIIDDSATVREQIIQTLCNATADIGFHEAGDGIEAFKLLLVTHIDLILCDLEMPRMDGFKFLALIGTREELKNIPVIILTGRGDRDLKISGLEHGACDYVTKPFDADELIARVRIQLKIKQLQDQLMLSNEKLKESNDMLIRLSNTDPLTQLYNRRYMTEMLDREMPRSLRTGAQLSLVIMDIDHFKHVNDTYGHQNGDLILVAVANAARNDLRSYDFVSRYGGEEFVLTLPDTCHEDAVMVAERLRKEIENLTFGGDLSELRITISMGVATYPNSGIATVDELIKEADDALYRAKEAGRNQVCSMFEK